MTLIELIVAIGVLGFVVSTIAAAIFVGLQTTRASDTRLSESNGVSLASAYFVPDVASATTVTLGDVTGCQPSGTPVVRFNWQDSSGPQIASYVVRVSGGAQTLVRRFCVNGSTTGEFVVARGLSQAPAVACSPACGTPASVAMTLRFTEGPPVQLSGSRRTAT